MNVRHSILVVDDDTAHRTMLRTLVGGWGYEIHEADDGEGAIRMAGERAYDLVLMDVRMLKVSGLEALAAIKSINPAIPVVIMTAFSSVETAVAALKQGAHDYLTKPLDFDKLRVTIERAMEHTRLREENRELRAQLSRDHPRIIGRSPAMERLLATVAQVAPSEATVLICGESGTGKEVIARTLHAESPRRERPFISLNCAAITESLLESELFGHEKGAFTGAERRREGRFHQADGGTLFLDEVSEMPLAMQVKLLRVLQEREFTRVGGDTLLRVDVRAIAATNRRLPEMIASGRFRDDLYYRLNVVGLEVPPLRERREDIPLLAQHFLETFAARNRKTVKGFTPQAMDRLVRAEWPGNVRELMNAVERAVVLTGADYLGEADFPMGAPRGADPPASSPSPAAGQPLSAVERTVILETLTAAGGNKSEAARRLGITRRTLHKKLKAYGVMK
jgi:two-component system response regulator HydG